MGDGKDIAEIWEGFREVLSQAHADAKATGTGWVKVTYDADALSVKVECIHPKRIMLEAIEAEARAPDETYQGPIEPGMKFVWEPNKPHARAEVEVTRVVSPENDERRIFTIATTGKDREEYWNDESRFREAVVPLETK